MTRKKISILLIEDNPGDARLMQEFLDAAPSAPFVMEWVDSLEKGLARLDAAVVDIILLDLSLPDSQGIDTFFKIQNKAKGVAVVVLTGLYDEALAMQAVHAGAQDYLVKGQADGNLLVRSIRYAVERQRIEEQLRKMNDFNQSILKALPFGMDIVDEEGNILYLNENLESLFGKESVGKKCWLIYKDDKTQCRECTLRNTIVVGELRTIEVEGVVGGKIFQIMHVGMIYEGKKAVLEIFNDITERRRIEQMKSDFVAMVSHQLKTPVGEIRGYIDNMLTGLTGELNAKQKQYLAEMQHISLRAYRLIADLLNVSRIERGIISVKIQPVTLQEIVTSSSREYREEMEARGITVVMEGMEKQITCAADKDKMIEVVSNIINNAVKFTPQGRITIRLKDEQGFGFIEIEDTGAGISPEFLNKIFKKEQALGGSPRSEGGAGLGLYIAKSFMLLQKGDVSVQSGVGKGSKFIIKIPLVMV
ncbi:MAG: ATP-binding protein [Candidatus Omnitrophota bacterium]|jgi:PAS domain S-box-containing protein